MSYRRAAFGFALPISLVLACAGCGQSNQGAQNQPAPGMTAGAPATTSTAPNPMSQSPMNQNAMTPTPPMTNAGTMGMGANRGGTDEFAALAGAKGYITQSDAMRDHWMNEHFQQCDSDHDGKLSRAEYETCRKQNGGMQQPQGSA